ncbi:hypothetical protein [Streptomyces fulvoviolaceus]|uniref:hypothetical protein n=1 Tax=Streptomyces fulvoviolaceus TaxID=285535 RepID=UPI0021BE580A|nr:hypothetical protein [Streptomyces fulvoviolaceus]MCT9080480.1 hypothetical protein [Streptomyces fulvoviolaceus]
MKKLATHSWAAREALARREPFHTYGAFRAVDGYSLPFGNWLPSCWQERYRADGDEITYTVLSYGTPIAWVLRSGEVVIPDVKYSRTTTDHQGLLYALGQPADGPLARAAQEERQAARARTVRRREPAVVGNPRDSAAATPDIVARIDDVLSRAVPANSGEAAIYSTEYLERRYGAPELSEAA